jgi:ribosomal protein S5
MFVRTAATMPGYKEKDPKNAGFSPLGDSKQSYRNPYATYYPPMRNVPDEVPEKRPYERLLTVRRIVRLSSKGKHSKFDAWVLVGDRNGSAGVGRGESTQSYKAVQLALRRARQSMKHFEFFEGRTLYHDIDAQYRHMKIRLMAKPPGKLLIIYLDSLW